MIDHQPSVESQELHDPHWYSLDQWVKETAESRIFVILPWQKHICCWIDHLVRYFSYLPLFVSVHKVFCQVNRKQNTISYGPIYICLNIHIKIFHNGYGSLNQFLIFIIHSNNNLVIICFIVDILNLCKILFLLLAQLLVINLKGHTFFPLIVQFTPPLIVSFTISFHIT